MLVKSTIFYSKLFHTPTVLQQRDVLAVNCRRRAKQTPHFPYRTGLPRNNSRVTRHHDPGLVRQARSREIDVSIHAPAASLCRIVRSQSTNVTARVRHARSVHKPTKMIHSNVQSCTQQLTVQMNTTGVIYGNVISLATCTSE